MDSLPESLARLDEARLEAKRLMKDLEKVTQDLQSASKRAVKAGNAARYEAEKLLLEAREERALAQKMQEAAAAAMEVARQELDRARKATDEQRRETASTLAKADVEQIQEDTDVVVTSPVDNAAATRFAQYEDGRTHIAITGAIGSGKTCLIRALLGRRSEDVDTSPVGVIKKNIQMMRRPDGPFVFYDIPGTAAFHSRDWQYFNDHYLYVFDGIIVLFDKSFTMTDIAVLKHAKDLNIPIYIVCSKADLHTQNLKKESMEYGVAYDIEGDNYLYEVARQHFIDGTRRSVKETLEEAKLPSHRVYIVSSNALLGTVLEKSTKGAIDEADLLKDLRSRTGRRAVGTMSSLR